jgi:periplasmic divalent cation tolerance protein
VVIVQLRNLNNQSTTIDVKLFKGHRKYSMKEYLLVLITTPKGETADHIADALVENGLAACVNVIKGMKSVYRWKGNIEHDQEDLLLVKTRAEHLEKLTQQVIKLHPYEVPEVIALSLEAGSTPYFQWIDSVLKTADDDEKDSINPAND